MNTKLQQKLTEITNSRERAYRASIERARAAIVDAHPETGGDFLCAHNWGNEGAKAALVRMQAEWDEQRAYFRAEWDRVWILRMAEMQGEKR